MSVRNLENILSGKFVHTKHAELYDDMEVNNHNINNVNAIRNVGSIQFKDGAILDSIDNINGPTVNVIHNIVKDISNLNVDTLTN